MLNNLTCKLQQGEYIIHVGELAMSGTVGGIPQAPFGRYVRFLESGPSSISLQFHLISFMICIEEPHLYGNALSLLFFVY